MRAKKEAAATATQEEKNIIATAWKKRIWELRLFSGRRWSRLPLWSPPIVDFCPKLYFAPLTLSPLFYCAKHKLTFFFITTPIHSLSLAFLSLSLCGSFCPLLVLFYGQKIVFNALFAVQSKMGQLFHSRGTM
ncbi:hypothetical protein CEXT_388341 [Caerostris extrusa]|uniref:Uncharacterized protein n=1 Tax=Caerostris extrusa TaxID=172846 RepID=A0AAV4QTK4_CAEEX|nr:hypothetical protein CEXT_388341 [Caerostris extrusa]